MSKGNQATSRWSLPRYPRGHSTFVKLLVVVDRGRRGKVRSDATNADEIDRAQIDSKKPEFAPERTPQISAATVWSPRSYGRSRSRMLPGSGGASSDCARTIHIVAPPGKLGVVLDAPPCGGTAFVCEIKDASPLAKEVRHGDRILAVDGEDARCMTPADLSRLLASKRRQARRRITLLRREGKAAGCTPSSAIDSRDPEIDEMAEAMTNYIDAKLTRDEALPVEWRREELVLPPGRLGVILVAPRPPEPPGPPLVHSIREDSPLKGIFTLRDRIVAVDGQDVAGMTAIDVSKLLGSKSRNQQRRVGVLRRVKLAPDIHLNTVARCITERSAISTAPPTTSAGDDSLEC